MSTFSTRPVNQLFFSPGGLIKYDQKVMKTNSRGKLYESTTISDEWKQYMAYYETEYGYQEEQGWADPNYRGDREEANKILMRAAFATIVAKEVNPMEHLTKIGDIDYIYQYLNDKGAAAGRWHQGSHDWDMPFSMNSTGMSAEQEQIFIDAGFQDWIVESNEEGYDSD